MLNMSVNLAGTGDRSEYDIESYSKVVVVFQEWYGHRGSCEPASVNIIDWLDLTRSSVYTWFSVSDGDDNDDGVATISGSDFEKRRRRRVEYDVERMERRRRTQMWQRSVAKVMRATKAAPAASDPQPTANRRWRSYPPMIGLPTSSSFGFQDWLSLIPLVVVSIITLTLSG